MKISMGKGFLCVGNIPLIWHIGIMSLKNGNGQYGYRIKFFSVPNTKVMDDFYPSAWRVALINNSGPNEFRASIAPAARDGGRSEVTRWRWVGPIAVYCIAGLRNVTCPLHLVITVLFSRFFFYCGFLVSLSYSISQFFYLSVNMLLLLRCFPDFLKLGIMLL